MPLKTILVPLTGTACDPTALKGALTLARAFDAHVEALFVKLDPRDAVPMLGEGMSGAMVEEIMNSAEAEARSRRDAAHACFEAAVDRAGVTVADAAPAPDGPSAGWREVVGRMEELVPVEARLADVTVVTRAGDEQGQALGLIETALLTSGRPILLVPAAIPVEIGRTVAIAWNGNAESARAVAGAMPFLLSAETVHVLTAETSATQAAAGSRIVEYLSWHGVNAKLTLLAPGSEPVGKVLMGQAAELGCDLLVMGGYGHSRMREMILGGVTRYVLNNAGLPVLMAH